MTPWIVKTLWLILALPMLAAGLSALARLAGTEGRQAVAHGASRGDHVANNTSPGGAKGLGRMFSKFVRRVPIEWTLSVAPSGLGWFYSPDPRLSPWATILRHSVAYK
jgi:hypothetical protein